MKRIVAATLFPLLFALPAAAQIESMVEKGKGNVRYLGFIKVYDAYLYAPAETDTTDILSPDKAKCLRLVYDVALTSENFIEGADTILGRQHSEEVLKSFKSEIDIIHTAYQPVEENDEYTLCYTPESETTTLSLNGIEVASVVSRDFSSLYFGIWLGEKEPISDRLRTKLIGK